MTNEVRKFISDEDFRPEIGIVLGTRPGIVMFAPIIHGMRRRSRPHFVIHTGQHHSANMDTQFFEDLDLPPPDYRIEGTAERFTHGAQTAVMLEEIERILLDRCPRMILVGGDANTNLAGALAARKLHILVGHIEAGERSYDWRMPEEHNRVVIDNISDHLFATGEKAVRNLETEGIRGQVHVTGNPIVDASHQGLQLALTKSTALRQRGLEPRRYAILTMHREENVDDERKLSLALEGVSAAAVDTGLPTLFLLHPRTQMRLEQFGLTEWAGNLPGISVSEAVGYLDFLNLLAHAGLVFTDSGGVQQEACIHRVPCVTLRDNTEWTETLEGGANQLAGCDRERIREAARCAFRADQDWPEPFGDGQAAERIIDIVEREVLSGMSASPEPSIQGATTR